MAKRKKNRAVIHKFNFFWKLMITLCLLAAIFCAVVIYLRWPATEPVYDNTPDPAETSEAESPSPEPDMTSSPTPAPTPAPAPAQRTPMPADAVVFNSQWPDGQFSIVPPPFEDGAYSVTYDGQYCARVLLPPGSADRFNEYAEALVGAGASLLTECANATALAMDSIEIQLINDPSAPAIILYNEPELQRPPAAEGYMLPENGRLVAVSGDPGDAGGMALTYRRASIADIAEYVETLDIDNWAAVDMTNTDGNALYAEYRQDSRAIVIDYRFTTADHIIYCKSIEAD